MVRYCLIVFSFVFALAQPSTTVYAQDGNSEQASEDEARAKAIKELEDLKRAEDEKKRQQAEAREQQQEQERSKPKSPKKVFKPTEEISEDLPVPFPVDI